MTNDEHKVLSDLQAQFTSRRDSAERSAADAATQYVVALKDTDRQSALMYGRVAEVWEEARQAVVRAQNAIACLPKEK